jgi:hypothetical protein
VVGSFEHVNEISGSMTGGGFPDQLNDCSLLKDSAERR